jgi:hypothetical protein
LKEALKEREMTKRKRGSIWSWGDIVTAPLIDVLALSLGHDPKTSLPGIDEETQRRADIIISHVKAGSLNVIDPRPGDPLGAEVRLEDFVVWANDLGWELPAQMLAAHRAKEEPQQKRQRIATRHGELKASGVKNPTTLLAKEEGLSCSRIRLIVREAKTTKEPGKKSKQPLGSLPTWNLKSAR